MRIGINAKFLRKPGTGIGQVTAQFLKESSQFQISLPTEQAENSKFQDTEVFLYCEETPELSFPLPSHWKLRVIRSWYGRDDLVREHLWERFTLPKAVREDKCDVLFSLYQSATILPPSVRHVMFVHDLVPLHFPEYLGTVQKRFHYRRVIQAIGSARHIVAPSEATARDIVATLRLPHESVTVIPLGLADRFKTQPAPAAIDAVLGKYGLARGYIYHGGGLEKRKNTRFLLEGYAELLAAGKELPPLVISGAIHSEKNSLATDVRSSLEELKLGERVKLLGFVPDDDLPGLYAGALCFVYPSLWEGFGFPVLEALSIGVPTLASNTSSLPEVAGEAVLFLDPTDPSDLKKKLILLVGDRALREKLSQAGPLRARVFSWERFVQTAWSILVQ